jgi:hypothetical protein
LDRQIDVLRRCDIITEAEVENLCAKARYPHRHTDRGRGEGREGRGREGESQRQRERKGERAEIERQ